MSSEVKLFRLSGSAPVIDMRTGHNATLRPGLVVLSEDAHTHAMAALEAENARLVREAKNDAIAYKAVLERQDELRAERDSALAQLAAIQGGMGEVLCAELKACAAGRREDSPHTAHLMDRAAHASAAMAAEVERLREALESCLELIETISPFEGDTVRKARAALAAHKEPKP